MRLKLTRAATLIDKYGLWSGLKLYYQLRSNNVGHIQLPGFIYPFSLRRFSSDTAVFEQVFLRGEYDIAFPFQPRLIIDAGANIGLFSILMKNKFPVAKVVCIEPGKENNELLKKNMAYYQGVDIIHAGLWHSDARLTVVDQFNAGYSALTVEEDEKGEVSAISMDSLLSEYGFETIDILKIDIEGSERPLFLKNYENWLPKVKMIIIELHDWMLPGCSHPFFEAIQKTFSRYSYSVCGENTIILNQDYV